MSETAFQRYPFNMKIQFYTHCIEFFTQECQSFSTIFLCRRSLPYTSLVYCFQFRNFSAQWWSPFFFRRLQYFEKLRIWEIMLRLGFTEGLSVLNLFLFNVQWLSRNCCLVFVSCKTAMKTKSYQNCLYFIELSLSSSVCDF